jgi:uncharacterized protein YacL
MAAVAEVQEQVVAAQVEQAAVETVEHHLAQLQVQEIQAAAVGHLLNCLVAVLVVQAT